MSLQFGLLNPVQPGDIQQAGMLACVSRTAGMGYPTITRPNTSAIAAGFRQVGVLAGLPDVEVGRETDIIRTGALGLPQAVLFKSITSTVKAEFYGFDPFILGLGLGIDPVVTVTAGVAFSATSADSNTGWTILTVVTNTFVVGDTLQVSATSDTAYSVNIAKVAAVLSATSILLDRTLRELPASGTVSKLTSISLPIGGVALKQFSFAGLVDFTDGSVALFKFPKVQSTKPITIQIGEGQGAIKMPLELEALAVQDPVLGVYCGEIRIWPALNS